jgi:uncharacterized protein YbjT (DUF2867 family)
VVRILVTGPSGAIGEGLARALGDDHELRGLARDPARVRADLPIELIRGDALSGAGLERALDGVEVAYYLIHSMEPAPNETFMDRDREAARRFAAAAANAAVGRIVYLGGLLPRSTVPSAHLASRREVEDILLAAVPDSVSLRASIVVGARSRSFRAIVRLVERLPVIPLPPWRRHRTQPIDERDAVAYLAAAATAAGAGGRALDIGGPEVLSYGAMIERVADSLLLHRPTLALPRGFGRVASTLAARISGTDVELLGPLMASLDSDLLADDAASRALMPVPLHDFGSAVEHALRTWERLEPLSGR